MPEYLVSAMRRSSFVVECERVPPFAVFADSPEEAAVIAAEIVGRGLILSTLHLERLPEGE